jgi:hypothetical protein
MTTPVSSISLKLHLLMMLELSFMIITCLLYRPQTSAEFITVVKIPTALTLYCLVHSLYIVFYVFSCSIEADEKSLDPIFISFNDSIVSLIN